MTTLPPAAEGALAELQRIRLRHEVYAREGETYSLRWRGEQWQRRHALQAGVACRLAGDGMTAFASVAGTAATAGREAARAALASRYVGADPLPPRSALGAAPVPPPPPPPEPDQLERFALRLAEALVGLAVQIHEIRVVGGWSRGLLVTGEGFAGTTNVTGVAVEVQFGHRGLPPSLVHLAAPTVADSLLPRCVELVASTPVRLPLAPPQRGLYDVLLAPGVAGPLLQALAGVLVFRPLKRREISPAWSLVDARSGPEGLLPLPFDGEGVPSRCLPLLSQGRPASPPVCWRDCGGVAHQAGGAVRPSYADPPASGPANLFISSGTATPRELAGRIEEGWHLRTMAGPVRVDRTRQRFVVPATGVRLHGGEGVQMWPLVQLRAGWGRLLAALEAVGNDPLSLSLRTAVTTPSLLFRQLEVE